MLYAPPRPMGAPGWSVPSLPLGWAGWPAQLCCHAARSPWLAGFVCTSLHLPCAFPSHSQSDLSKRDLVNTLAARAQEDCPCGQCSSEHSCWPEHLGIMVKIHSHSHLTSQVAEHAAFGFSESPVLNGITLQHHVAKSQRTAPKQVMVFCILHNHMYFS